jgi:PD-(D/E)XK nuclease superfamily
MGIVYAGGDTWKVSASDLTFLFHECPRCFWMKLVGGLPRPRAPFPKVFTLLDAQTKRFFQGKRTREVAPTLPPGRVVHGERGVVSGRLAVPGHKRPLVLAGRFDAAIRFDDGRFGIADYKTAVPRDEHVALYWRQLQAYALALENPAPSSLRLQPVSQLGLLCVEPTNMVRHRGGVAYGGKPHWVQIPRDDDAFLSFLGGVLSLLERKGPPLPAPDCGFCSYLTTGALTLIAHNVTTSN